MRGFVRTFVRERPVVAVALRLIAESPVVKIQCAGNFSVTAPWIQVSVSISLFMS